MQHADLHGVSLGLSKEATSKKQEYLGRNTRGCGHGGATQIGSQGSQGEKDCFSELFYLCPFFPEK